MSHSTSIEIPAKRNYKKSPRLQFIDTGLLNYTVKLQDHYFALHDLHSVHKGLIAEHIVGQELLCSSIFNEKLLFWVRDKKQSSAEVDYVYPFEKYLIPVEVKAGKSGTLRSLHQFMDRCPHRYAVRLYAGDLKLSDEITPSGKKFILLNLPYFLTIKLKDYISWMITHA